LLKSFPDLLQTEFTFVLQGLVFIQFINHNTIILYIKRNVGFEYRQIKDIDAFLNAI